MEEGIYLPDLSGGLEKANTVSGQIAQSAQTAVESGAWLPYALIILIIIGVILLLFALRLWLHRLARKRYAFKRKVFLVILPKEAEEEAKKKESTDQKKDIKEVIAVMETLYAAFTGIRRTKDWTYPFYQFKKFWVGSHRHISMEIIFDKGLIKFFVVAPEKLGEYVEQQIHAEFPNSEIEETTDYNIFQPHGAIIGTYLKPAKSVLLPLKTYKKLDGDPTEGLLNNLSKLKINEGAAIQMFIRPVKHGWQSKVLSIAQKMHKGDKLDKALGDISVGHIISTTVMFPFKVLGDVIKAFTSSTKSKQIEESEKAQSKNPPMRIYQREEEIIKSMEEKISKANFEINLNLIASADDSIRASQILRDLVGSFAQFTAHESGNGLREQVIFFKKMFISDFIYRNFRSWKKMVLSTEELASIWHFPLPSAKTPNILWLQARKSPPPMNMPDHGLLIGNTVYRGQEKPVYVLPEDRRRHVYIIGSTGVGKSVLLSNMIIQDIQNNEGVCVIDPHGTLIEDVLPHIPKERVDDVIIFDPSDIERPVGLNMLEAETPEQMDFAIQEMIAIFYKLVTDPAMIGPMFEHNMRNAMLTLMADKEYPGTLADIPRIFTDAEFQKYKLKNVTDPMVRAFWEKEMAKTSDFHKSEMLGYLISKVGRFVENEMIRNIIGQPKSGFNVREVMDNKKILLVNLAKGKVGEVNSNLLGLIIVSKLQMAALSRADMPEEKRNDFFLYIDEFQNFITDSISTILAEARKYKLDLTMAHQYIGQLLTGGGIEGKQGNSKIKDAVFGNVGTIISFRVGVDDAEVLAKQFAPALNEYDVMNIDKFHAYVRLLIKNAPSRPFTIATIYPSKGNPEIVEPIKELSRLKYGRDRALVNAEILERTKLGEIIKTTTAPASEPTL
ncbi:MAG: type IV secretory system conjugative DNA transfer family protein [Candidatus Magasanikbacteria bacterium]|nr:type IV secretory system conjugative DNA transfer family protein [Candidatus Magasanikbacteria bacterium]